MVGPAARLLPGDAGYPAACTRLLDRRCSSCSPRCSRRPPRPPRAATAPAPHRAAVVVPRPAGHHGRDRARHPVGRAADRGRQLLITERTSRRLLLWDHGDASGAVRFPAASVWASGETGLMSLAVDPVQPATAASTPARAAQRPAAATTSGWSPGGSTPRRPRATRVTDAAHAAPGHHGRHGGCRLLIASDGALMVGTGDAAVGTNPRNLHLPRRQDAPAEPDHRRALAEQPLHPLQHDRNARYVLTYGHRNVQGLAQRADGTLWSVEHGTDRDDEVNRLATGGDYGWNPVPGYNESVPMTDQALPGTQINARWRSGNPTIATSGSAWVRGQAVGRLQRHPRRGRAQGRAADVHEASTRPGGFSAMRTPAALRSLRPAALGDRIAERRPAGHHGQRRRRRRGPAGAPARLRPVRRPSRADGAQHDRREPHHERHHRQPRHPAWAAERTSAWRARTAPATGERTAGSPTTGPRRRCRGRGTARTPSRPSRRTPTETPSSAAPRRNATGTPRQLAEC